MGWEGKVPSMNRNRVVRLSTMGAESDVSKSKGRGGGEGVPWPQVLSALAARLMPRLRREQRAAGHPSPSLSARREVRHGPATEGLARNWPT